MRPGTVQDEVEAGRAARRGRRPLRLVLAAAVLLAWVVHTVATWLGGYQTVPLVTLQDELASGQVTSYVVVDRASDLGGSVPWWQSTRPVDTGPLPGASIAGDGTASEQDPAFAVVYTVDDGRPRVAVPSWGRHGPPSTTSSSPTAEETRWLQNELLTSAVDRGEASLDLGRTAWVVAVGGAAVAGTVLVHILLGPVPRRGTRWFWFWMLGLPAGLGAVAYAIYEIAGWRAAAAPPTERRATGLYGLFTMIVWGVVIGVALQLALHLVGATVIPL